MFRLVSPSPSVEVTEARRRGGAVSLIAPDDDDKDRAA